jgi:endonuclease/exonuclease/phosphatase family metal-dependent hydrolase
VALAYPRGSRLGGWLRWHGLFGLIAVLSLSLTPGVADAAKKKKKEPVKVLSYNLYLGSDLANAVNAGLASRTDLFANEVGEVLRDVNSNDFTVRARRIADDIRKKKVDVAGLQEAALWKIEIPTDGGGPPRGTPALVPLIDYIDTLLNELNKKAKSKKQCGRIAKKREAQGKKPKPCYRGYRLVVAQQEADVEQLGDFDNNPGPNGRTFDLSDRGAQAALGAAAPSRWLDGNDDTPEVNLGEPPPAQCSDGIDNDGDGLVDYGPTAGVNETSGPALGANGAVVGGLQFPSPPPWGCDSRLDNDETANLPPGSDPNGLPQDANFDHSALAGNFGSADEGTPPCTPAQITGGGPGLSACPTGVSYDSVGNGRDAPGITDCPDNSADAGPADGTPNWPFSGVGYAGATVPVCMFHGIDGDLRLQMRDVIIARKGAGVKTRNVTGGNFSPASTFRITVFGTGLNFTRGWTAADVNVRGKKFHLVNTHLESESFGTIREDQASELVAPGGPATAPNTVLIGDLNSDPARAPTNLPNGDSGSDIAINRLFAAGFRPVQPPGFSGGHGTAQQDVLNDLSNVLDNGRIDHILTNSPSISFRSGTILDGQIAGLWASDHGGVFSRLKVPGGKKK